MKMRMLVAAAMAGVVAGLPMRAETSPPVPNVAKVNQIVVHGGNGAFLRIYKDGSADLYFGADQDKVVRIPQHTFSFDHVYNMLTPQLVSADSVGENVGLPSVEDSYGHSYHFTVGDQGLISKLLADAKVKLKSASS